MAERIVRSDVHGLVLLLVAPDSPRVLWMIFAQGWCLREGKGPQALVGEVVEEGVLRGEVPEEALEVVLVEDPAVAEGRGPHARTTGQHRYGRLLGRDPAQHCYETCIRHRECRRLSDLIIAYKRSSLRPSVHTYGSLIKACGALKRIDQCWEFWAEMEGARGLTPNDIVVGCMLDALVCNSCLEDAVDLLEKWKSRVPPNTVMYSTVIKGFANSGQPERAMATWKIMREQNMKMNTVVYNSIIDAQARVGAMENVSELIEKMEPDGCKPDSIT